MRCDRVSCEVVVLLFLVNYYLSGCCINMFCYFCFLLGVIMECVINEN